MESFVSKVEEINGAINGVVWGWPMLILILGTGLFFTFRTKFFQITKFGMVMKNTFLGIFKDKKVTKDDGSKSITQFQALSTALAATIGTGNIVGVATALTLGGAGAIFWMWVSAIFGMMTNFAENVLGIFYRYKNEKGDWVGGPMVYIEKGLGLKWLAILFSIFCIGASFGIGNMTQINSISESLESSFDIPTYVTGIVAIVLVALVILGGIKRIGKVAERIVPFMALLYVIAAIIIVCINIQTIPSVFATIFKEAFNFRAVGGGVAGTVFAQAIKMGFKRGVFSNEAGLGSSVIVHSASNVKEPVKQGMWGIFEVFFDTIIVCTLTALVILSTDALETGLGGAQLSIEAFKSVFGSGAGVFMSVALSLFAFTTLLGWSYYGQIAMEYIAGVKSIVYYKVIFLAVMFFGATMHLELIWNISDTLNAFMAIPNLIAVLLLSKKVISITNNYMKRTVLDEDIEPIISHSDAGEVAS